MKITRFVGGIVVAGAVLQGCDSSNGLKVTDLPRPDGSRPESSVQLDVFNDFVAAAKAAPDAAVVDSTNLFGNSGFESGLAGWTDCAPGATSLSADAHEGSAALLLANDSCFYRSVEAVPGNSYVLSCEVKLTANKAWTGMGMVFANGEYSTLSEVPVAVATSGEYTTLATKGIAPEGASFVSMWLHSDHGALVDNCSLVLESNQPPVSPDDGENLLSNGNFSALDANGNATHWTSGCGGVAIADGASLYLADGSCVDQALTVGGVESIRNNSGAFSCFVSEVDGYSDLSIFLDNKVAGVRRITSVDKNTRVTVDVSAENISNGFVTLYSEGHLKVEECTLSAGVVTTDLVVDPAPTDPVVDPAPTDPVVDPAPTDPVVDPAPTDPVVDPTPTDPVPADGATPVVFASDTLEAVIRAGSQISNDTSVPITRDDLLSLTSVDSVRGSGGGIDSFEGLEYALNLETINLTSTQVTDLTPLAGLTKLKSITMRSPVSDISPLAGLTALKSLSLSTTPEFSDLAPLAGLTSLESITFKQSSSISDLTPLSNLRSLETISIESGKVADASAIASLPSVSTLFLQGSPLTNIQALVNGVAIGDNDIVELTADALDLSPNSPDLVALHALQDLGVTLRLFASAGGLVDLPPLTTASVETSARYRLTFNATWSAQSHPVNFPPPAHFSDLAGAVHNDQVALWRTGELASSGIELMAETGDASGLLAEAAGAVNAGSAASVIDGGGVAQSPGAVSVVFEVTRDHPLVSITSMVAPSPDWFVGIRDVALFNGTEFVESLTIEAAVYDSGTDSGLLFTSGDVDTQPAAPITLLSTSGTETNFANGLPSVGQFVIQKLP